MISSVEIKKELKLFLSFNSPIIQILRKTRWRPLDVWWSFSDEEKEDET